MTPRLAACCLLFLSPTLIPAAEPARGPRIAPGATLVEVFKDPRFFEGPTWDPKTGKLYFTAFGQNSAQILRLDAPGKATVWLDKTEGVNGTYLGNDGRLLGAQGGGKRIVSYAIGANGPTDTRVVLHDAGLNGPNDLCQTAGGNIYFTDPYKDSIVYLLTPAGKKVKLIDDLKSPNGIIASNDGKTLYVGDSSLLLWRSYPIQADGTVGKGKDFFTFDTVNRGAPDGMSIDEEGNLYLSGLGGVWIVNPQGQAVGHIATPEFCSNCSFGGEDGKTLYFTCSGNVLSLKMTVRGGQFAK